MFSMQQSQTITNQASLITFIAFFHVKQKLANTH